MYTTSLVLGSSAPLNKLLVLLSSCDRFLSLEYYCYMKVWMNWSFGWLIICGSGGKWPYLWMSVMFFLILFFYCGSIKTPQC